MIKEWFNVLCLSDSLDINVFETLSRFLLCGKGSPNFTDLGQQLNVVIFSFLFKNENLGIHVLV